MVLASKSSTPGQVDGVLGDLDEEVHLCLIEDQPRHRKNDTSSGDHRADAIHTKPVSSSVHVGGFRNGLTRVHLATGCKPQPRGTSRVSTLEEQESSRHIDGEYPCRMSLLHGDHSLLIR
jgi:hypothetical protein